MVTPVATSSAKKRRRSRTTTPTSRQPTDDDSVDGGEDTDMTLVEVTSIQPASTQDERPGGHVENELDPDLTFIHGPGNPRVAPEFTGQVPHTTIQSEN
jgi:hypothetical protein